MLSSYSAYTGRSTRDNLYSTVKAYITLINGFDPHGDKSINCLLTNCLGSIDNIMYDSKTIENAVVDMYGNQTLPKAYEFFSKHAILTNCYNYGILLGEQIEHYVKNSSVLEHMPLTHGLYSTCKKFIDRVSSPVKLDKSFLDDIASSIAFELVSSNAYTTSDGVSGAAYVKHNQILLKVVRTCLGILNTNGSSVKSHRTYHTYALSIINDIFGMMHRYVESKCSDDATTLAQVFVPNHSNFTFYDYRIPDILLASIPIHSVALSLYQYHNEEYSRISTLGTIYLDCLYKARGV